MSDAKAVLIQAVLLCTTWSKVCNSRLSFAYGSMHEHLCLQIYRLQVTPCSPFEMCIESICA